jgi:hypothetical protein
LQTPTKKTSYQIQFVKNSNWILKGETEDVSCKEIKEEEEEKEVRELTNTCQKKKERKEKKLMLKYKLSKWVSMSNQQP